MKPFAAVAILASFVAISGAVPHHHESGPSGSGSHGPLQTGEAERRPHTCNNKWIGYTEKECNLNCGIEPSGGVHRPQASGSAAMPPLPTGTCKQASFTHPEIHFNFHHPTSSSMIAFETGSIKEGAYWTCGGCAAVGPTIVPKPKHYHDEN